MATTIKDKSIDNLWMAINDYKLYSVTPPPSSKLIKRSSDTLGSKDTKLSGNIVYFIPKKNGKITGKPVRLLHIQKGYILAENVEPYYENILKNKKHWQNIGANDLIAIAEQKVAGIGESIASKFSGADGVLDLSNTNELDINIPKNKDVVISDRYINTNVGGYRNRSFTNLSYGADGESEVVNLTNSALPHGNPHDEFDLQFGVDGKNVDVESNYLGTPHSTFDIQYGVSGIEDANKQVYTAEEMAELYKKSGTKKTFKDWLSSANTQNFIDSLNNIVKIISDTKGGGVPTPDGGKTPTTPTDDDTKDKKTEATILGMSPVTFGIVAVGSLIFASVVTIYVLRQGSAKKVNA